MDFLSDVARSWISKVPTSGLCKAPPNINNALVRPVAIPVSREEKLSATMEKLKFDH